MRRLEIRAAMPTARSRATRDEQAPESIEQANLGDEQNALERPDPDQRREQYQQLIESVKNESVAPAWADKTRKSLASDFSDFDEQFLRVRDIDCHSSSCLVAVEWNDYPSATTSYRELLHKRYQTNCQRSIILNEPAGGAEQGPFQATMVFTCSESSDSSSG